MCFIFCDLMATCKHLLFPGGRDFRVSHGADEFGCGGSSSDHYQYSFCADANSASSELATLSSHLLQSERQPPLRFGQIPLQTKAVTVHPPGPVQPE
jgi:hypothetical protein